MHTNYISFRSILLREQNCLRVRTFFETKVGFIIVKLDNTSQIMSAYYRLQIHCVGFCFECTLPTCDCSEAGGDWYPPPPPPPLRFIYMPCPPLPDILYDDAPERHTHKNTLKNTFYATTLANCACQTSFISFTSKFGFLTQISFLRLNLTDIVQNWFDKCFYTLKFFI